MCWGFDVLDEIDGFLKRHSVFEPDTPSDFEREQRALGGTKRGANASKGAPRACDPRCRRARQRDLEGRQGTLAPRRGSIWETATYDPDSDTFYQGIGNAGPDFDTEYGPWSSRSAEISRVISPTMLLGAPEPSVAAQKSGLLATGTW
jgi:hypothetical protein